MLATTIEIIRSGLKADPTISPTDRARFLVQLRQRPDKLNAGSPADARAAIWTRKRVAEALGNRSLRLVDRLAQEGVLTKVTLPGRKRATGFRAADVERLISGGAKCVA